MAIIDKTGRPAARPKKSEPRPRRILTQDEARAELVRIVNQVAQADRRAYGRPDYRRIALALNSRLNADHLEILKAGACGDVLARVLASFDKQTR